LSLRSKPLEGIYQGYGGKAPDAAGSARGRPRPFCCVAVVTALLLVGLLASFLPARKAAAVEPIQALRDE
jgi:hypothetical protein